VRPTGERSSVARAGEASSRAKRWRDLVSVHTQQSLSSGTCLASPSREEVQAEGLEITEFLELLLTTSELSYLKTN
jgi:hypothetical protein